MAEFETEAVVLRTIRYSEADNVITLLSPEHGRLSAIAKGARRQKSRLGGRLQPAVVARLTLHRGRSELCGLRGAAVVEPHAGLWHESYRLLAAGAVLESAAKIVPADEENVPAYTLIRRTLALLTGIGPRPAPPRLDPIVLASRLKLLVISGLMPRLGGCVQCGATEDLVAFSAIHGGALCRSCGGGEPLSPAAFGALAHLLGSPLADAGDLSQGAADEVERVLTLVLSEHLGVRLRSASPI